MSDCQCFAQIAQDKWATVAQVAQRKWATVSESLRSLRGNERPWAKRSGRSEEMSDCEWFAQVAQDKLATLTKKTVPGPSVPYSFFTNSLVNAHRNAAPASAPTVRVAPRCWSAAFVLIFNGKSAQIVAKSNKRLFRGEKFQNVTKIWDL